MKERIKYIKTSLVSNLENKECSKFKIWKFTVEYFKNKTILRRQKKSFLEYKTRDLEQNLKIKKQKSQYNNLKVALDNTHEDTWTELR